MARPPAPPPVEAAPRRGRRGLGCACGCASLLGILAAALAVVLLVGNGVIRMPGAVGGTVPPTATGASPGGQDPQWTALRENPITRLTIPAFPRGECDPGPAPERPSLDPVAHQRYLSALAACLDRLWEPILQEKGIRFVPLTVRVGDPATAAGGCARPREPTAAYYCPENHTVTFSPDEDFGASEDGPRYAHTHYLWVLDHEYAHHVQALTGVFEDVATLERRGGREVELDLSRRIELQAACLGEATLAQGTGEFAITASQRRHQSRLDSYETDTVHGSAESQHLWSTRGLNGDGSTAVCATFSAQARDVD